MKGKKAGGKSYKVHLDREEKRRCLPLYRAIPSLLAGNCQGTCRLGE